MIRFCIWSALVYLLVVTPAWAVDSHEEQLAQKLEGDYSAYLEAQLYLWHAERNGQGTRALELNARDVPDLDKAYRVFATKSASLENTIAEVKDGSSLWVEQLADNIENARAGKPAKQTPAFIASSLEYLEENLSLAQARKFAPVRWQAIQEIYGSVAQEKYLEKNFTSTAGSAEFDGGEEPVTVVWIQDPWADASSRMDLGSLPDFARLNNSAAGSVATLAKTFGEADTVALSNFEDTENQANELRELLRSRYLENGERIVLVSSGQASAVVYRLLDLYPYLRTNDGIVGWVNWNGRLYGMPLRENPHKQLMRAAANQQKRALAGVATPWTLTPKNKLYTQLTDSQFLRAQQTLSLGKGFPIISIVAREPVQRSSIDMRESLVTDGELWVDGDLTQAIVSLNSR